MKIVIIGGVAAGTKAAAKIKRINPNIDVTIYTDDEYISYSSCGIPYYIEGNFDDYRMLLVRSVEDFNNIGVKVFIKSKVIKILLNYNKIIISKENIISEDNFDKLIIATGARPILPNINGYSENIENIFTIRKISDAIRLKNYIGKIKTATIIGSGYIGIELLEAFVKNNIFVNIIERNEHIFSNLDIEMSILLKNKLISQNKNKFKIFENQEIEEFIIKDNIIQGCKFKNNTTIQTDIVIICIGVEPNSEIAKAAGINLGVNNSIRVNKMMQTNIQNIYACGDCAEKRHLVSNKHVWIPLGSTANKEGRCCAINISGDYEEFNGVLGSMVSRCLNTTIAMTGLSEKIAKNLGFNPVSVIVNKSDIVGYMPNVGEITLKLIADKLTGILLGAQAIGSIGADKRVNSVATALLGKMTVEDFVNSDFTYAPPFSPTIDPLINAIQKLKTMVYE